MMKKFVFMAFATLAAFASIGCSSDAGSDAPAPKGTKPESVDLTDSSKLTPQQQELAKARGASGEASKGDQGETEGGR